MQDETTTDPEPPSQEQQVWPMRDFNPEADKERARRESNKFEPYPPEVPKDPEQPNDGPSVVEAVERPAISYEELYLTEEDMEMLGRRLRRPRRLRTRKDFSNLQKLRTLQDRQNGRFRGREDLSVFEFPELAAGLADIENDAEVIGDGIIYKNTTDGYSFLMYAPELVPIVEHVEALKRNFIERNKVISEQGQHEKRRIGKEMINKARHFFGGSKDTPIDASVVAEKLDGLNKLYHSMFHQEGALYFPTVKGDAGEQMIKIMRESAAAGQENVWDMALPSLLKASSLLREIKQNRGDMNLRRDEPRPDRYAPRESIRIWESDFRFHKKAEKAKLAAEAELNFVLKELQDVLLR